MQKDRLCETLGTAEVGDCGNKLESTLAPLLPVREKLLVSAKNAHLKETLHDGADASKKKQLMIPAVTIYYTIIYTKHDDKINYITKQEEKLGDYIDEVSAECVYADVW